VEEAVYYLPARKYGHSTYSFSNFGVRFRNRQKVGGSRPFIPIHVIGENPRLHLEAETDKHRLPKSNHDELND
jgi:hypothetical protein